MFGLFKKKVDCKSCGTGNEASASFCKKCGAPLIDKQVQHTSPTPSVDNTIQNSRAMIVKDIFSIAGRGTVVTGFSENTLSINMTFLNKRTQKQYKAKAIEVFRKIVQAVEKGKACGLLFEEATRADFEEGDELIIM